MKTVVIYHRADFDGLFCREIARKFLGENNVTYIGWDYGDPVPTPEVVAAEDMVYMLDISIEGLMGQPHLVWIDHHLTAIEKYGTKRGFQMNGVAACRLAWQWFTDPELAPVLDRNAFFDRLVKEPCAVQLAGEYDIWDTRNPAAETFQFGLRSIELTPYHWENLLNDTIATPGEFTHSDLMVSSLLQNGRLLQRYQRECDAGVVAHRSSLVGFAGLKFLALNTARCNSLTFAARDVPETGHDALMGFYWTGTEWSVSLYHARHRTDLDLSTIAVKHGGGGHRGACGFRIGASTPETPSLPFSA